MKLFRLTEDFRVELVQETVALIPEFAEVLTLNYNKSREFKDADGRKRTRALKEFIYIYFMYDFRSEYIQLDDDARRERALGAAGLDSDYPISSEMQHCIDTYVELQETRELKLIKSAWESIEKIIEYFDNATAADAEAIMKVMGGIGKVVENLKMLEDSVRKQLGKQDTIRGDKEVGRLS